MTRPRPSSESCTPGFSSRSTSPALRWSCGHRCSSTQPATEASAAGISSRWWGVRALVRSAPASIPRLGGIAVDGWVLLFAAAVSLSAALLFGLAPALHAGRADLASTLAEGGRWGSSSAAGQRFRRGLAVGQIALALVLLVGAGLLVQSFVRLRGV